MSRTKIKIAALATLTTVGTLVTACGDVEGFYEECESLGGEVQTTVPGGLFSDSRIDCIVDNKIVYLKGYN